MHLFFFTISKDCIAYIIIKKARSYPKGRNSDEGELKNKQQSHNSHTNGYASSPSTDKLRLLFSIIFIKA